MRFEYGQLTLSASDLSNHLGCRHLTSLDLVAALGQLEAPDWQDPLLVVLRERGHQHEKAYLDHLQGQGREVYELPDQTDPEKAFAQAREAMASGRDVILQAVLVEGRWRGRADVLLRVEEPSELGNWSYEVVDTKLARETRAGTILQLCLYSEIVGGVQGRLAERMHVVSPGRGFEPESFRAEDYLAYHRFVKKRLEEAVGNPAPSATYPEPREQCDICRWWPVCDQRRRADDHLSLVAGISKLQIRELKEWEVATLRGLGRLPIPFQRRPARGSQEALLKVREQARVQLEGRERGTPIYELLPRESGQGLYRLPEPSPGDVFLDLEGDPFASEGGFDYLFGYAENERGRPEYRARWAFDAGAEKAAFEWLADALTEGWSRHPDLHVYHYAPYEPSALKRLMGRYATREDAIDRMLRAGLFVDLYTVARQTVRASVESYSIKNLEVFCGFERSVALREASLNLHGIEYAIAMGETADLRQEALEVVEGYNRDDCLSAMALREWLEVLRAELIAQGEAIGRPEARPPEPSEALGEWQEQIRELQTRLSADVPFDPSERTEEQQARWILAELLEWHRREGKAVWWEYFRLRDLPEEELLYERRGLYGLEFVKRVGGTDACPVDRYRFPEQDFDIREKDEMHFGEVRIGTVVKVSSPERTVDIQKMKAARDLHPRAVFAHLFISPRVLQESLFRLATWAAAEGVDAPGLWRAGRDLLLACPPRLASGSRLGPDGRLTVDGEDALTSARRLVFALHSSVLPIQGPPGSGKTYAGAHMICDLLGAGKKVGVTAVSHKVIRNLLQKVVAVAEQEGVSVCCVQKPEQGQTADCPGIVHARDNATVDASLHRPGPLVVGGTAWLWAREELAHSVDVLFVDEAGQMSLADVLAVSQAGKNLVLLGDPQQLEQPIQGCHPEGTAVSALEHLLKGHQTMPPDRGLFLPETWRLHPTICSFTSELFYENRLHPRPGLEAQSLVDSPAFSGAGLWYVAVSHEGNQTSSPEEVERVERLVGQLLEARWVDKDGHARRIDLDDLLIVCPYNAQVSAVAERISGARVGTVDKFQGQEAPVVVYSMATSSPEEAPRGMEFLYSLNRLNVATSRARGACILVASPLLFEPDCHTPRQMRLANAFCRYLELTET